MDREERYEAQLDQNIRSLTNAYSDESLADMDVDVKEATYRALLGNMTEKEAARAGDVHLQNKDRLSVNSADGGSKHAGAFGDALREGGSGRRSRGSDHSGAFGDALREGDK